MKNRNLIALFLLLLIFTIPSCTLTKRHYQPGYHVEWHFGKKVSTHKPEQVKENDLILVQEIIPCLQETDEPVLIASENSYQIIDHKPSTELKDFENSVQLPKVEKEKVISKADFRLFGDESLAKKETTESVVHWTAGAALGLGILGFVVPFFPCIAAIVFGIIALNKINSEPEKFKGRGLAIAGIVLGVLGLVFIIGLAVLMFMAFL